MFSSQRMPTRSVNNRWYALSAAGTQHFLLSPCAILWTWVLFALSVARTGFLPPWSCRTWSLCMQSFPHPLPPASLLEIPLWRWQYPHSLVQLHFKDLIMAVDTLRVFLPKDSSGFLPLRLTLWLRLNYWFSRHGFPSSSLAPCPSVSSYLPGKVSRIRRIPR